MADTKCWTCQNYAGGCPWTEYKRSRPVRGWTAERRDIRMQMTVRQRREEKLVESYVVLDCPLYVYDGMEHVKAPRKQHKNGWTAEEWEKAVSMRESGFTLQQIGTKLGRTRQAVCAKFKYERKRKWSK